MSRIQRPKVLSKSFLRYCWARKDLLLGSLIGKKCWCGKSYWYLFNNPGNC